MQRVAADAARNPAGEQRHRRQDRQQQHQQARARHFRLPAQRHAPAVYRLQRHGRALTRVVVRRAAWRKDVKHFAQRL